MVTDLDVANSSVESMETQAQKLEKENKDLNQGKLLFILCNDQVKTCSDWLQEKLKPAMQILLSC